MKLNFVISRDMKSKIFKDIFSYFNEHLPSQINFYISKKPEVGMDVYHYHRPHLEKTLKKNSVVTVHHDLYDTDPSLSINRFLNVYQQASKVVCLNKTQESILNHHGINHTTIIPHGVNANILKKKKKKKYLTKKKLCLGILSKRYTRRFKGEAYLFELFKRLDPKHISFCFIGKDRYKEYDLAQSYGFESLCYDYLPYELYRHLYDYIDILFIPSLYEGGPANVPEALYTGTPILGFAVGMINDWVKPGKNGYILTGNIEKDAELIIDLACNKNNIMTQLIASTIDNSLIVPSWQKIVNDYVDCYQMIFEKKRCHL